MPVTCLVQHILCCLLFIYPITLSSQKKYDRVEELLGYGADPNAKDFAGWTPLVHSLLHSSRWLSLCFNDVHLQLADSRFFCREVPPKLIKCIHKFMMNKFEFSVVEEQTYEVS